MLEDTINEINKQLDDIIAMIDEQTEYYKEIRKILEES